MQLAPADAGGGNLDHDFALARLRLVDLQQLAPDLEKMVAGLSESSRKSRTHACRRGLSAVAPPSIV